MQTHFIFATHFHCRMKRQLANANNELEELKDKPAQRGG